MKFAYSDAGRGNYFKGDADDCVIRAIVHATKKDYKEVYDHFKKIMPKGKSPRTGVHKKLYHKYLLENGFEWMPFMMIGTGCTKHLKADELPKKPFVARLSRHLAYVDNHTVFDTYDCTRDGGRCVYGIYIKKENLR